MANETLGGMWRIFRGRSGTVTINQATPVAVANKLITADSVIVYTVKTVGGTVSASGLNTLTKTPGTGFTVAGLSGDTSVYSYTIIR